MIRLPLLCLLLPLVRLPGVALPVPDGGRWISESPAVGDFVLVQEHVGATPLLYSSDDYKVVALAAADLAADINRVSGQEPRLAADEQPSGGPVVVIGTLGRNRWIDDLVASGRLDVADLRGEWETFLIATVEVPWPDVPQALIIVGSDRRGTAFGAYELSQAIGVSPWHWWADVPPVRRQTVSVSAGARRFGPPSVRYRGIFLNDEDWALQPWAALTHEPENGDIGPRTYERIFELLLRLKANTLWPAMHPSTQPFNSFRENPRLADDYAIVMGSSHAEPMLRNNVGEWAAPAADYNYLTHREDVLRYWEERVRENAAFESIYTLGMRGIHDSHMQGPRTDEERIAALQQVFRDQRELLARHVDADVDGIPQMFCAYKEVLVLYRQGLDVPDDVTIVWPDDNFGYVRNFAGAAERHRAGGFGVYYHLSYLGRPLAYLWLHTTPPALVWQEMVKAHEHGADRMWIANVGDLKPAEIGTEFFLQLAWDIDRWGADAQPEFLKSWAAREFGAEHAEGIAQVMNDTFQLNFQRKPEHLQWWRQGEAYRHSTFTAKEADARLQAFSDLVSRAEEVARRLPASHRDAYFQLVLYPVAGSAAANRRFFHAEWYARLFNHHLADARRHAAAARLADEQLHELTTQFNTTIADGKWRHFMTLEPADNQWRSMRIAPLPVPAENLALDAKPAEPIIDSDARPEAGATDATVITLFAGDAVKRHDTGDARWETITGLGRSGRAVTIFPFTAETRSASAQVIERPFLEFDVTFPAAGSYMIEVQFLPTHPLVAGRPLRVAVALGDGPLETIEYAVSDGSAEWAQGVLDGVVRAKTEITVPAAGDTRLRLAMVDAGVVVDRLILFRGAVEPSYFGPDAK